ncbi:hypothetical protein Geob_3191 [Geotalea daltonii FRC-32]|uniref:Amidohydrolase-related domain-containing protein n=1 Tax=Geotalea daltonii (strain DSM 22248 / JCM 15807 / FRC-32) TaxID=316067 RepID=B9M479_GEODF|nr:amidohydrolase family protein [Geotalea daltonii]ACM21534.1 hypothetical protein Geob_3191 [Geotalea daltonii FRC-32]
MPNYFIDCHCHMFTIADIPLYQSVFTFVGEKDKLHKKLIFPFVFPFAGVLLPIVNLKKIVQSNEKFIRFFECEPGENVVPLCKEINTFLDSPDFPTSLGNIDEVILTPLVMDFDKGGGVEKLRGQVRRLSKAIEANKSQRVKILPFVGIDPRRADQLEILKEKEFETSFAQLNGWKNPAGLASGIYLGVKLYPPLGFNVRDFSPFYKELCKRQWPVTVHCQKDSFRLCPDAEDYTNPRNWEEVFKAGDPDIHNLRINFAHFGGEDGIADTAWFEKAPQDDGSYLYENFFQRLRESSWTASLIRLLKNYPNTYADVAAFDFTRRESIAAFLWILHKDKEGHFPGNYGLEDKLLWGTDYPMTLEDKKTTYATMFHGFFKGLKDKSDKTYQVPDPLKVDLDVLMCKMVRDNPLKFLRFT